MATISDLIWYLVEQMEKHQGKTIHQVMLTGTHLDFAMSRHDDLMSFASESGNFTLSNNEGDVYPQKVTITYSDYNVRDELHVYIAEEIDGEIVPNAILHLQQHDEFLCQLIHQIEAVVQENPSLFQQHSPALKEQFLAHMDEMYDRYVPEVCKVRFVGYYLIEGDNIPLARLANSEVVTITSSSVPLQIDEDYPAIQINGEYFVRSLSNTEQD